MKAPINKNAMIAVAVSLVVMFALAPKVWISGTTIVTLSRGGTLTVRPMGLRALAVLRAIGVDIEGDGIGEMSGNYCVECGGDIQPPPWHKFRFLIIRLVIKEGVTRIASESFADLNKLKSITFADGMTDIPLAAFANCERLKFVTIPGSVTKIGGYAFRESGLKSVTIPGNVTSIGFGAFISCTSLTSVIIEDGVSQIGNSAFSGCTSVLAITISKSVTEIGRNAFFGCTNLTSIDVDNDNPRYSSVDGVMFNNAKDILVRYPGGKQGAYTVPTGVKLIGIEAFSGNTGLTSITIPKDVRLLGGNAFGGCTSLTSITCLNPVPPVTFRPGESWTYGPVFDSLPPNACLYVPEGSISAYSLAKGLDVNDGWERFKCIKPITVAKDS